YALQQHPIEGNEERDLHHHRQASRQRVYLFALVQLHHRASKLLAVILVGFLNLFHARRDRAHLGHGTAARLAQWIEQQFDEGGDDDDGPSPIAHEAVDPFERDEERMGENREQPVIRRQVQSRSGGRQLRLQLGPYEQGFVKRGFRARWNGDHRSRRAQQILLALDLQLDLVRLTGLGNDGRDEMVLQRCDPTVGYDFRKFAVRLVLDFEVAGFGAVVDRGPLEGVGLDIEIRPRRVYPMT